MTDQHPPKPPLHRTLHHVGPPAARASSPGPGRSGISPHSTGRVPADPSRPTREPQRPPRRKRPCPQSPCSCWLRRGGPRGWLPLRDGMSRPRGYSHGSPGRGHPRQVQQQVLQPIPPSATSASSGTGRELRIHLRWTQVPLIRRFRVRVPGGPRPGPDQARCRLLFDIARTGGRGVDARRPSGWACQPRDVSLLLLAKRCVAYGAGGMGTGTTVRPSMPVKSAGLQVKTGRLWATAVAAIIAS